jgi:uncharacterized protein (DUF885 family)
MRNYLSLVFLLAAAVSVCSQETKPAADRVAAQKAIFEDYYESELRNFPERATAFGDYRYNDKLDDYSLDGVMQHRKTDESFLARIQAIPTSGLADQDQLSHDLLSAYSSNASLISISKSTRCPSISKTVSILNSPIYRFLFHSIR